LKNFSRATGLSFAQGERQNRPLSFLRLCGLASFL
jgi:hypothetical protein